MRQMDKIMKNINKIESSIPFKYIVFDYFDNANILETNDRQEAINTAYNFQAVLIDGNTNKVLKDYGDF